MIYKAERVVKYRYTCEKCANTTDWYEGKAWMTAANVKFSNVRRFEFNVERSIEELEKTAKEAVSNLEKLTEALETIVKKSGERFVPDDPFLVEKYNEAFIEGAKCPYCKARQSWYPAFAFRPNKWRAARNYAIATFILSGAISIIAFAILNGSEDADFSNATYLLIIPIVLSVISALIGFFRAKRLAKQYAPTRAESFILRDPEVVWEEPTVELVGCPTEV